MAIAIAITTTGMAVTGMGGIAEVDFFGRSTIAAIGGGTTPGTTTGVIGGMMGGGGRNPEPLRFMSIIIMGIMSLLARTEATTPTTAITRMKIITRAIAAIPLTKTAIQTMPMIHPLIMVMSPVQKVISRKEKLSSSPMAMAAGWSRLRGTATPFFM